MALIKFLFLSLNYFSIFTILKAYNSVFITGFKLTCQLEIFDNDTRIVEKYVCIQFIIYSKLKHINNSKTVIKFRIVALFYLIVSFTTLFVGSLASRKLFDLASSAVVRESVCHRNRSLEIC